MITLKVISGLVESGLGWQMHETIESRSTRLVQKQQLAIPAQYGAIVLLMLQRASLRPRGNDEVDRAVPVVQDRKLLASIRRSIHSIAPNPPFPIVVRMHYELPIPLLLLFMHQHNLNQELLPLFSHRPHCLHLTAAHGVQGSLCNLGAKLYLSSNQ